ncbi:MAG: nucleotidyltransferase domain-containing protein [Candidatus Latescibacterota bacterium]|nr:nucleotidyltransferase domain-containing protein [Candidatus Latescibacterota bacterium]
MLAAGAPLKVVLFGSHARGQAHPESDLDLLVIEESTLPRYGRAMP